MPFLSSMSPLYHPHHRPHLRVMTNVIDVFPSISHHGWFSRTNMAAGVEWEEAVDLGYTSSRQTSHTRCLFIHIWSVDSSLFMFTYFNWFALFRVCLFAHVHVCSLFSLLSRVIISLTECHYMRSVICWLYLS